MASCFAHAGVAATGTCDKCQTPICMRCTKGTLEGFMCPPCAHKTYGRRKLVTALKIAGLVGFCLAIGLLALVVIGKGSRNEKPKPPVLRDPDAEIAIMLDERDQAPCDRRLIRKLADRLGQLDRYKDVVDHTSAFFAKCGAFPRLEWSVVYALQQLGRYAEAVKHETVIIEDDPFDSDYWWWRGEDRARSNQPDLALADYRQSFATARASAAAGSPRCACSTWPGRRARAARACGRSATTSARSAAAPATICGGAPTGWPRPGSASSRAAPARR